MGTLIFPAARPTVWKKKKNQPQFTLPSAQEWKINCFNFYRNECFMSCSCFSDRVLNLYILSNAWMFSKGNALWTTSFLGFWSTNTRSESAVTSPGFGELSYLFIYEINRKKSTHYCLLRESYHYYCGIFPPSFFSYASKVLLPSSILCVFLFTCMMSQMSQWACITCIIIKFGGGGKTKEEVSKVSLWYNVFLKTFHGKLFFRSNLIPPHKPDFGEKRKVVQDLAFR